MVPVPSLYEFLSFHRLSRETEEYQTPTCLADLDRERHGNLRLLEQTLMPHDDSVISVATGTSGAGRLFPFPNLEKLEFEERLEQQQETEKLKRPRLRKHAEETDASTEVRREPRFCPEPLHASRSVSVTRPSTSSTFFLREDQAFAEACEELRVFLEAGVQASLALLAAPQGASQPGKEAAGKDREKEKTGLVSSSRQEPEESQKGSVVEDVDLARKNIFWLETASLASFVSHFEDQTRLHIAAHTVELMDAGRSGRTLLAEEVQNARAAVALTFPTGEWSLKPEPRKTRTRKNQQQSSWGPQPALGSADENALNCTEASWVGDLPFKNKTNDGREIGERLKGPEESEETRKEGAKK
uniref:Uncharacterized protein n=1 Tax=Toxoplasma gondii TgCATBr9 TaxID=943120 RepID=A0A2T6IXT3_TOXGO|nr:hypothetical protein TGBR9_358320 [Toxoplasma gondii TgCATBr9]